MGKTLVEISNVEFDRSRFRRYYGNIGEMVAEEFLVRRGFDVWLFTPYSPNESPLRKRGDLGRGGLLHYLSYLYLKPPDRNDLGSKYIVKYGGTSYVLSRGVEDYHRKLKELKNFFGEKLEAFSKYVEELGIVRKTSDAEPVEILPEREETKYYPDLVAKKSGEIYVVEVKTNTGLGYLKGAKLKGLLLAEKYGFIPTVITLNIDIEATNLKIISLARF
jgi:hypothetical protein